MRHLRNLRNLRILLVIAFPGSPLSAQTQAFESITPTLAVTGIAASNDFGNHWSSAPGIAATIESPFYAGHAELGIDFMTFDARDPAVPGFSARYLFVGWGLEAKPMARLALKQTLRLGTYAMHFDAASLPASARNESEMALDLVSRVAWRAAGPWQLSVSGQYRTVLTDPLIRHLYLSAGISRSFTSPEWLRDFLD
jgi:hypothetical protein